MIFTSTNKAINKTSSSNKQMYKSPAIKVAFLALLLAFTTVIVILVILQKYKIIKEELSNKFIIALSIPLTFGLLYMFVTICINLIMYRDTKTKANIPNIERENQDESVLSQDDAVDLTPTAAPPPTITTHIPKKDNTSSERTTIASKGNTNNHSSKPTNADISPVTVETSNNDHTQDKQTPTNSLACDSDSIDYDSDGSDYDSDDQSNNIKTDQFIHALNIIHLEPNTRDVIPVAPNLLPGLLVNNKKPSKNAEAKEKVSFQPNVDESESIPHDVPVVITKEQLNDAIKKLRPPQNVKPSTKDLQSVLAESMMKAITSREQFLTNKSNCEQDNYEQDSLDDGNGSYVR